jgi:hypothetical protein
MQKTHCAASAFLILANGVGPSQNAAGFALGAAASRFGVPQKMEQKKETFLCPTYMLSGIAAGVVFSPSFRSLEHVWVLLATPVAKTCDAVGGAFRP